MTELPPRTDNAPDQSAPDNANVVVHPPVLWVLLVAVGYGLDFLLPLPFMPAGFAWAWVGGGVWLAGFALAVLAIRQFRRAGTEVQMHTPTAAIVDTGVFAFSRNPNSFIIEVLGRSDKPRPGAVSRVEIPPKQALNGAFLADHVSFPPNGGPWRRVTGTSAPGPTRTFCPSPMFR